MSFIWLSASFCYYLILTLVNTFSKVYITGLTSSFSEMLAYVVAGVSYERVGVKVSLISLFGLSTIGGILILLFGLKHQDSASFFIYFLVAKFGISGAFSILFVSNSYFFPTLFAATALGICNFLARIFSAFSFVISELDEPTPMIIFTIFCILSVFAAILLQTKDTDSDNKEKESATETSQHDI